MIKIAHDAIRNTNHMKKRSFTLIELLIVLVIIGIVATLILPQYKKYILKAHKAEAMTITRAIADAAWAYYMEAGSFPRTETTVDQIPHELNVSLPQNPTKYYTYCYTENITGGGIEPGRVLVAVTAVAQPPLSRFENAYTIFYMYDTPTYDEWTGQKMDNHWYRYYVDSFVMAPGGP